MKKKTIFGVVLLALLVLQTQMVFAQDRQTFNLLRAVSVGNVSDARAALQKKADVNYSDGFDRPLTLAVKTENLEMVRLLLEHGANPNLRGGENGNFALPIAIEKGNLEIVRLLLDRGANVNRGDHIGASPLRWAIDSENIEMVRLLLDRGANINDSDRYGAPFPNAAYRQNLEILKLLLERGANINARCNNVVDNRTALHHAVSRERMDIVRYLVENGININARDSEGRSALNIALDIGEMNIHAYLLANGAMEFEPNQAVAQPAAPAPSSTTNVYVQPSVPAQSSAPSTPTLQTGTYAASGTNHTMTLVRISDTSGTVSYYVGGGLAIGSGSYRISNNQITLSFGPLSTNDGLKNKTFIYTITSSTSFSGSGEVWARR
jgi:ankyrin repeat protein